MRRFEYAVLLAPAEEGGFVVTCRGLPEVITQGENVEDALTQAVDAMDEAFAARMKSNEDFPKPTRPREGEYLVSPPAETVLKAALYIAMREAGVTKVELAKRLGVDEKEVRRLLDPHHGSKLPRIAEAVQLLGKRLRIELVA
jgi:antitoxin HicB